VRSRVLQILMRLQGAAGTGWWTPGCVRGEERVTGREDGRTFLAGQRLDGLADRHS
jgi:hypothetical protein